MGQPFYRDRRFWLFTGMYVVLMLATLPLILHLVPPNRWYGFRLPGAMIDPKLWYEVNALGGKFFIAALLASLAINVLLFWKGTDVMVRMAGWINAGLVGLSFWLVSIELINRLPSLL